MWQCKECGKKFHIEPVYCDFCGATEDFLEALDQEEVNSFYQSVEKSFQAQVGSPEKSFEEFDDLIKDFMSDEYKPLSTRVKEPFEDEEREKKERAAKEARLTNLDRDYYDSIKHVVGDEGIEKDDYYKSLEELFKEPESSGHETTFNGIFKKEDTIENTFLNPKKKIKRSSLREGTPPQKTKKKLGLPLPGISLRPPGQGLTPSRKKERPEDKMKLIKLLGGLGAILIFMIVLMFVLVNNIVDSGDKVKTLPSAEVMMEFFTKISSVDEATFLADPSMVSFYGYAGDVAEKQAMLKNLYALVTAADTAVSSAGGIREKGINRIQVDYEIKGSKIAEETLHQLLFRTVDDKNYQLDFSDFVIQYTLAVENNPVKETPAK